MGRRVAKVRPKRPSNVQARRQWNSATLAWPKSIATAMDTTSTVAGSGSVSNPEEVVGEGFDSQAGRECLTNEVAHGPKTPK